jgi:ATP-dependent exoDNAse (exonuclease V) beta subunit
MGSSKYKQYRGSLFNKDIIVQAIDYADDLKSRLRKRYGDNCEFYPELSITSELNVTTSPNRILGIIDLLVVDKEGQVHYFDYKTSPKPYDKFDSAKKRAYQFQLAMYGKLLKRYGLSYRKSDISILPIQF